MRERVPIALLGGFLGAGKTTLALELARRRRASGGRVAIVTNDQGRELVDTTLIGLERIPAAEVSGGCFCCRFSDLLTAAHSLLDPPPDLLLAEAVGSCTDLNATVWGPLHRLHGHRFRPLPTTVVVDPLRALAVLTRVRSAFPAEVDYLYEQQVTEADILVVNKADTARPGQVDRVEALLARLNPTATVIRTSALRGTGVDVWADLLQRLPGRGRTLPDLDYDIYAAAEAHLAWLNATACVSGPPAVDLDRLLGRVAAHLSDALRDAEAQAAHIKLVAFDPAGETAVRRNLTSLAGGWRAGPAPDRPVERATILVNARVCADPRALESMVWAALRTACAAAGPTVDLQHLECFRPSPPVPTYRYASA